MTVTLSNSVSIAPPVDAGAAVSDLDERSIIGFIWRMAVCTPVPDFALQHQGSSHGQPPSIHFLCRKPAEWVWLDEQFSTHTRLAYKRDVNHFVRALGIRKLQELRLINRAAVVEWVKQMREAKARPRTIRRRLSALSSLFKYLVEEDLVETNPVREITRPKVKRREGATRAFSQKEARRLLDAPDSCTLRGLRDRAVLAVGLQVGARRAEIARLTVRDLGTNAGYPELRLIVKGDDVIGVTINPQTAQRINDYLAAAGHSDDLDGPLFRPLPRRRCDRRPRRAMHPCTVDRILRRYARAIGLPRGYSAHSMRATFVTTALENGANLEDVQHDVGHADPSTTKLYDRRGHNPERAASFFAVY